MEVKIDKLKNIFIKYFGDSGLYILKRELVRNDIESLKYIPNYKKVILIRSLCRNVFSDIFSVKKISVIKSELISIFGLTSKKYYEIFLSIRDNY